MTHGYCLERISLFPPDFHLKKATSESEIGFLEGIWKPSGLATRYLRVTIAGDRGAITGILNHLLLRDAVFGHIDASHIKRHNGNILFLACDFGDDSYVWPAVRMEHAAALTFSLNALPQLRADPLILQYAHAEALADGRLTLTVIAGCGARFAGDMRHIDELRESYASKKLAEKTTLFREQIHALENRLQEVSKENSRMRDAMATIANGIDDELFRPPKRKRWPWGPRKKNLLGEAMIRAADELRAALSHAYTALL